MFNNTEYKDSYPTSNDPIGNYKAPDKIAEVSTPQNTLDKEEKSWSKPIKIKQPSDTEEIRVLVDAGPTNWENVNRNLNQIFKKKFNPSISFNEDSTNP